MTDYIWLTPLRWCIDFGLVVLIAMVQLLIYPSYAYFENEPLIAWHRRYAQRIACIVGPLMCAQLAIAIGQLFVSVTVFHMAYASLVLSTWLITAIVFVPIHRLIDRNQFSERTIATLVAKNWLRTFLWIAVLALSLSAPLWV